MLINKDVFTKGQLNLLAQKGIVFKDGYDYSDDDYCDIEDKIVDNIIDCFREDNPEIDEWEDILDVFQANFGD